MWTGRCVAREPTVRANRIRQGCFFFQAEDGIRDYKVTGVQTCALPIFPQSRTLAHLPNGPTDEPAALTQTHFHAAADRGDHRLRCRALGIHGGHLLGRRPGHPVLAAAPAPAGTRSEEHTSELQSPCNLV